MVGVRQVADYFATWVASLLEFWEIITRPNFAGYMADVGVDLFKIPTPGLQAVSATWNLWATIVYTLFGSASLLEIILGSALAIFVIVTIIKWIFGIIT